MNFHDIFLLFLDIFSVPYRPVLIFQLIFIYNENELFLAYVCLCPILNYQKQTCTFS